MQNRHEEEKRLRENFKKEIMIKHQCSYCTYVSPYRWSVKRHTNAKHTNEASTMQSNQKETQEKNDMEDVH